MMRDFLFEEGYTHVRCVQPACAAETLSNTQPGIVLLEINPVWPAVGLQLLKRLRSDSITATTPIIICTTNPRLVEGQAAARHCAVLEKPFQLEDLLKHLQMYIGPPGRSKTIDATS
jgi:DNA-binding response OmpR family regulator